MACRVNITRIPAAIYVKHSRECVRKWHEPPRRRGGWASGSGWDGVV